MAKIEVEMADVPARYLDLGEWVLDCERILAVRRIPRTVLGVHGSFAEAHSLEAVLRTDAGNGLAKVRIDDPQGVQQLRHWLGLRAALRPRAA